MITDTSPRRLWTNYFTTIANALEQQFTFTTNDDYRDRKIETIFVGLATAGIQLAIYVMGQEYATIDLSRFAAGDAILNVDILVPAKLQPVFGIKDLAGALHTNVPVTLGYRVDANAGP